MNKGKTKNSDELKEFLPPDTFLYPGKDRGQISCLLPSNSNSFFLGTSLSLYLMTPKLCSVCLWPGLDKYVFQWYDRSSPTRCQYSFLRGNRLNLNSSRKFASVCLCYNYVGTCTLPDHNKKAKRKQISYIIAVF